MKNFTRRLTKRLFNTLPLSVIDLVINGKLKAETFRSYLSPNKELIVDFNNKFFGDIRLRIDKIYPIEREIIEYGVYDEQTLTVFKNLLKAGDICIDIGANMGGMTFALANFVKTEGRVFAVEPGPELYDRLEYNLNLNKNLEEIISLHKIGFSDKIEDKYWQEIHSRGNAGFNDREGIKMELITLDNFSKENNISKIDFIKIDVEGMELEIIKGGIETIKEHKPYIYYESWVNRIPEWDRKQKLIENIFKSIDYKLFSYNLADNKFQQTEYPHLDQNTLAAHVSRIAELEERINKSNTQ